MQVFLTVFFLFLLGACTAYAAQKRGRDPTVWMVVGMLLGILGLILVFLLPPVNAQKEMLGEGAKQVSSANEKETIASDTLSTFYKKKPWFYLTEQHEQVGPLSFGELEERLGSGALHNNPFVWCEDMTEWRRVEELGVF